MAREWSLSRWVRLYVVESADEAAWEWQARCVWPLLIKAADRAGVIETTKGAKGLAAVIHMPLDVVTPAVEELLADGCLVTTARGYLLRNYFEAQNAEMAGSLRQAEYKARKRASAALGESDCNGAHSEVTRGDTGSRTVTPGDSEVTRGDSEQRRAETSRTEQSGECERDTATPVAVPALTLTPEAKRPRKSRTVKVTTLAPPTDPEPSEGDRAYAVAQGVNLADQWPAMFDHHRRKGEGSADWSASWRTWCRNAVKFAARDASRNGTRGATGLAATAEILAERAAVRAYVDPFKPRDPS